MDSSDFDVSDASSEASLTSHHPLHATNQQLEYNGHSSILNDARDDLDLDRVKIAFCELLKRESELMRRVTDSVDEHRKSQADVKRLISRNESLSNDVEQRDRHLAECKSRELKQIKRIDDLELKLRKKTEETRKLTISSKNTESKFNIDKRKLEMVNAKFKDKISDLTKGATTKERQKRFDAVVNVKQVLDVYETDQTYCMAVTGALKQTEENIRQLVGENQILKNAVKNAKAQIYETLSAFPNYTVVEKSVDIDLMINPQKIEVEIATNCQAIIQMIQDLDCHNKRQISEMEKDLEARQEKQLVTKVAEFETKLDEVKATVSEHQPPVSEEAIFQQMAEIVQHEQDGDETDDENIGNAMMIENYLRDCSNQTPPTGESVRERLKSEQRTPDSLIHMFEHADSNCDENDYSPSGASPYGASSHSTPLQKQLVTNLIQSPAPRQRSKSKEGLKPSHLFPSSRYDDDSLEIS